LAGGVERSLVGWKLGGAGSSKQMRKLAGLPAPITALSIRPKPTEIAVGLNNGWLYVLGRSKKSPGVGKSRGPGPHVDAEHAGGVKVVAYHPGGDLLVSGGTEGRLVWRDAQTRKVQAKRDVHSSEISALAFSPDGRRLASGDWNGEIKIWSVETREIQTTLSQPGAVAGMAWVDALLVSGGWDGRLRFWSTEREETIGQLDTGAVIHALAVNPAGDTIATVSRGGEVQLWRMSAH
jgi:WD40 repeat protein